MKDALLKAIEAAGGQSALARVLKIKAQSVQCWLQRGCVPPLKVLAIEAATGVPRHELRPDLYPLEEASVPPPPAKRRAKKARKARVA